MEPERKLFPRSCTIKHRPFSVDCRMKLRGQERYLKSRLLSLSPMYIQKMCVYINIYIYIYTYIYTYIYIYIYIHMYVCVHVCIHIHVHPYVSMFIYNISVCNIFFIFVCISRARLQ